MRASSKSPMKKSIKILPGHPFLLRPQLSQLSFRTPTVIEKFSGARPWYILDHRSIFGYSWPIAHGRNEWHETNQAINSLSASLIHRARTRAPLTSLVQFWLQNCKTQQVFHKVRASPSIQNDQNVSQKPVPPQLEVGNEHEHSP